MNLMKQASKLSTVLADIYTGMEKIEDALKYYQMSDKPVDLYNHLVEVLKKTGHEIEGIRITMHRFIDTNLQMKNTD